MDQEPWCPSTPRCQPWRLLVVTTVCPVAAKLPPGATSPLVDNWSQRLSVLYFFTRILKIRYLTIYNNKKHTWLALASQSAPRSSPSKGPSGMFQPTWVQTKQSLSLPSRRLDSSWDTVETQKEPVSGGGVQLGPSRCRLGTPVIVGIYKQSWLIIPLPSSITCREGSTLPVRGRGPQGRKVGAPAHVRIWNFP